VAALENALSGGVIQQTTDNGSNSLASHFLYDSANMSNTWRFNKGSQVTYQQYILFRFSVSSIATIEAFRSWLENNPVTVIYPITTATDTIITDTTLIAQLEALVKGGAEEGTTYIKVSATDPNLPGLLYVEAPKYE
jgi:hypothetical protein